MPKLNLASNGLQFVLCPGRFPGEAYKDVYNQIFDSWYDLWSSTYAELKDKSALYSDTFTRQDFIAAIFLDGKCQAFILFRHVDILQKASLKDSYFEQWSDLHIQNAKKNGPHVLICGNLGIHPQARRDSLGFSMKELMMGFITEISLQTSADVVISTPRTDRNVHTCVYRWGGVPVAQNIDWGLGVIVDLAAFYKNEVRKKRTQEIVPLIEELWEQKLVIPENHFESINAFIDLPSNVFKIRKAG